jgi:hypothetical protein
MKANPLYVCQAVEEGFNNAIDAIDTAIDVHITKRGHRGVIRVPLIEPQNMVITRDIRAVYAALGWVVKVSTYGMKINVELRFR